MIGNVRIWAEDDFLVDEGTDFKVKADVRMRIGEAQIRRSRKRKVSRKKAPIPWCIIVYCFRSKDSRCFNNNYKIQYLTGAL